MNNHSLPSKAVLIIGQVSSGKSTLAKQISETYGAPIVSFGRFLLNYCILNNLPTDRASLQRLGEKFIQEEPDNFLLKVLNHNTIGDLVIIEGVRHKIIFETIKKHCSKTLSIFLDVNYQTRYERFLSRTKESDSALKSEIEFKEINNHPVESKIEHLKNECDICVCSLDEPLTKRLNELLR